MRDFPFLREDSEIFANSYFAIVHPNKYFDEMNLEFRFQQSPKEFKFVEKFRKH